MLAEKGCGKHLLLSIRAPLSPSRPAPLAARHQRHAASRGQSRGWKGRAARSAGSRRPLQAGRRGAAAVRQQLGRQLECASESTCCKGHSGSPRTCDGRHLKHLPSAVQRVSVQLQPAAANGSVLRAVQTLGWHAAASHMTADSEAQLQKMHSPWMPAAETPLTAGWPPAAPPRPRPAQWA